jgi:hypothetical protein
MQFSFISEIEVFETEPQPGDTSEADPVDVSNIELDFGVDSQEPVTINEFLSAAEVELPPRSPQTVSLEAQLQFLASMMAKSINL